MSLPRHGHCSASHLPSNVHPQKGKKDIQKGKCTSWLFHPVCTMYSNTPDVREMWDEFTTKQDEPLYIRNVISGLSGIMLVSFFLVGVWKGGPLDAVGCGVLYAMFSPLLCVVYLAKICFSSSMLCDGLPLLLDTSLKFSQYNQSNCQESDQARNGEQTSPNQKTLTTLVQYSAQQGQPATVCRCTWAVFSLHMVDVAVIAASERRLLYFLIIR